MFCISNVCKYIMLEINVLLLLVLVYKVENIIDELTKTELSLSVDSHQAVILHLMTARLNTNARFSLQYEQPNCPHLQHNRWDHLHPNDQSI